jgi:hypothetical protein
MTKDTNDWTLEAVGFYGTAGADVPAIIEYIDYRDHYRYSRAEIETALKQLAKQKKTCSASGKVFSA